MLRDKIIKALKKYFCIEELVGPRTFKRHGDRAWKFFSTEALEALLITRELLDTPMTINNWKWGGKFKQRGLRTNLQAIFIRYFLSKKLYLSAHVLGEGFDFDAKGMTAEQVRRKIYKNQLLYPMKIRLEHMKKGKPITWVHLDTIHEEKNPKVYFFNV